VRTTFVWHERRFTPEECLMSDAIRERIDAELRDIGPLARLSISVPGLMEDALQLLAFMKRRGEPSDENGERLPGLRDAALPADTAATIQVLRHEIERCHRELAVAAPPFPVGRVLATTAHLKAVLEWLSEDDAALAEQLAQVRRESSGRTAVARLVTLERHIAVAKEQQARMEQVPAYRPALRAEAEALVEDYLRGPERRREHLERRRNGLIELLRRLMRRIIAAADMVFAEHPHIAREARSERLRRLQRAANRARRRKEAEARAAASAAAAGGSTPAGGTSAEPTPAVPTPTEPTPA
jgi:hypothetical protein